MRIISGDYGGRPLKAVKGKNTRPTTDKVKESLFHMIGPYFAGGKVLDLYAGSGSLGIEAVSRGMDLAYLIDKHPAAVATLTENVAMTKEEEKFIIKRKNDRQALEEFKQKKETFDLVLLDPPYERQDITAIVTLMIEWDLLNPHAQIICEVDKHTTITMDHDSLIHIKEKVYGLSKIIIFEWRPENE